jgi:hypothetical protein
MEVRPFTKSELTCITAFCCVVGVLVIGLLPRAALFGQTSRSDPQAAARDAALQTILASPDNRMAVARRKAAVQAAREFDTKFNDVAIEMNRLAAELREKGTFNIKQAAIITKAWRKLRADAGWLEKDKEP